MISEREELTLKNGATIVLSRGEDGITVNITGFDKPMIGTFDDPMKLANAIGKYLKKVYPEAFKEDLLSSKVPEQERDLNKLSIRLRRIDPTWTRLDYNTFLWGD